jgi:tyrosine-protein kinase Etk/Wzc
MTQVEKPAHNSKHDEIDLGRVFGALLDFKWWVVGTTAAIAFVGFAYATLAEPIYRADALLQVEEKSSGLAGMGELGEMFSQDSSAVTEIEIIKSRMVLGTVVSQLQLDIVFEPKRFPFIGDFLARRYSGKEPAPAKFFKSYAWGGEETKISELSLPNTLIDKNLTLVAGQQNGSATEFEVLYNEESILSGVTGQRIEKLTRFGKVSLRIAELTARPGSEFSLIQRTQLSVINSLQGRVSITEKGRQSGILDVVLDGENPREIQETLNAITQEYLLQNIRRNAAEAEKSLEFLQEQLPVIREELQMAENQLNAYRLKNESVDIRLETEGLLTRIVELEKQLNEISFKEAEISRLYTRSHPTYRALIEQKQQLQTDREQLQEKVRSLPETQQEVLRLTRDVEVNQEIYVQLQNQAQELNIMRAGTVGNVRIIDQARVVSGIIAPQKSLILTLSIIIGLILGVVIALSKGMLRRGVETPKDLEEAGISVYASVPLSVKQSRIEENIKRLTKRGKMQARKQKYNTLLLARDNPEDNTIEALRSLRTSLHFAMAEAANKVVMISGPSPEVGKTFVTSNLAVVLAQAGMKVLLIDADMRRGYMHTTFSLNNEGGLSKFLAGGGENITATQETGIKGLDYISRGPVPPNPSELLMSDRFTHLMEWANREYDIILIDTPPILAVTDPAIVGRYAGTTLLVARFMKSHLKEIEYTIERFAKSGVDVKGVILNGIEKTARSSYGYGSYGYYSYAYQPD